MANTPSTPEQVKPDEQPARLFDDRKEHYESLISLFKYAIGSLTLLITLVGGIIGFITYSDGKEMRQKELEMHNTLLNLIKTTREDVSMTGQRAINQINSIRDESTGIARLEAKKRIEQVFEENKIEDFIVQVAKERLEPQIQKIVDNKIVDVNQKKFEKALRDLVSNDEQRNELAYLYFQNADPSDWSDEQLSRVVDALKKTSENSIYKSSICIYVGLSKSPVIEDFFKDELVQRPRQSVGDFAFYYLIRTKGKQVLNLYLQAYEKYPIELRPNFYFRVVETSCAVDPELTATCLNFKELIDAVFQDLSRPEMQGKNSVDAIRQSITNLLLTLNKSPKDYQSTYFFTKK